MLAGMGLALIPLKLTCRTIFVRAIHLSAHVFKLVSNGMMI